MRVFVAGATGVLGRRLVAELASRGHEVVGLARGPEAAERVRAAGGRPAEGALFDATSLARAAEGAEVVIHAATAIPTGLGARRRSAWAMNDRIRTEGTRALVEAAGRVGARRYLQQSVAWVVRADAGGPWFDEETPVDPPALLGSAVEGERIAREEGGRRGLEVGVLRGGWFVAADAAHTREMAAMLRAGRWPVLGRGDFRVAPVHADDAARGFALAAESAAVGTWNLVDDEPVASAVFAGHFAERLGARRPRSLPLWLVRLLLGGQVVEALTTSMNTSNARARAELGWAPRHPTYRESLAEVVAAGV
jgi:2-alkyl-3-oxoalkanoate reductase